MADTWFTGQLTSEDLSIFGSTFKEYWPGLADCVHTNSLGDRRLWFNLHKSTPISGSEEYVGWVNIDLDTGVIEFGEPAA